jgi:hypothetical protein
MLPFAFLSLLREPWPGRDFCVMGLGSPSTTIKPNGRKKFQVNFKKNEEIFLTGISCAKSAICGSYSEGHFLSVFLNERILAFPRARGKANPNGNI